MTPLEKFTHINKTETIKELMEAIVAIADDGIIQGRARRFIATKMAENVKGVVNGSLPAETLTREYGIRQQALYLKHYNEK